MIIKIGFDIQFELAAPTPMILMLYVHPSRQPDLRAEERMVVQLKRRNAVEARLLGDATFGHVEPKLPAPRASSRPVTPW